MFLYVVLFAAGFVFLIFGGSLFVDGAVTAANRLNVPEVIIGATVVSVGTTIPEVVVSAASAATGHGEIAYGNAIGSVICNTALILALSIAIRPIAAAAGDIKLPALFFFIAAALYMFSAYALGYFHRIIGIVLLALFVVYLILSVRENLPGPLGKNPEPQSSAGPAGTDSAKTDSAALAAAADTKYEKKKKFNNNAAVIIAKLIVGAALIALGANLLINNGTALAREIGVSEAVIGLTFVALGTSLPELVTTITSLIKGHSELSLGNIIGANLFNLVLVSGLSITISPFEVPAERTIAGINSSLIVDLPFMTAAMLAVTLCVLLKARAPRALGIALLAFYAIFCVYSFAV